ncbi:MAG: dTMP kinase, partial [Treponema sp.]|nr:dTMP kinase [Treponema sp.]
MSIISNFIVFEGGDGTGTSTQCERIRRRVSNVSCFITFEPTDGPIGKIIRSALKKDLMLQPETLARLFAADRNEHLYQSDGIVERCNRGEIVVSDRYIPSSLVYQGIECGEELPAKLNKDFPLPELLFYFDIDPAIALER